MQDIEELKRRVERARPDLPTARVIDLLVERYRGPSTVYSPADIARQLGSTDPNVVLAALLQLDAEPLNIIKSHWVYHDDDGDEFELSFDEVRQTAETGEFYHPLSGSRVFSYATSIGLVYESGPTLDRVLESRAQRGLGAQGK
jgi:hypothetical protein